MRRQSGCERGPGGPAGTLGRLTGRAHHLERGPRRRARIGYVAADSTVMPDGRPWPSQEEPHVG